MLLVVARIDGQQVTDGILEKGWKLLSVVGLGVAGQKGFETLGCGETFTDLAFMNVVLGTLGMMVAQGDVCKSPGRSWGSWQHRLPFHWG